MSVGESAKKDILCNHHAFHARKNSVEIFNASADRQRQFISLDPKQLEGARGCLQNCLRGRKGWIF